MKKKQETVTFKVDEDLMKIMKNLQNRSEFIRKAIIGALGAVCPLCGGSGILTPNQRRHWNEFAAAHSVELCNHCKEAHLVCAREH
ncbi:MAG: ribbon-helix-helix domain-containing protein [Syntrophales bacterium]|jgi:hypothetical protein|nr:ribbon-helix-helix domain-containing protein [Syntrophales bacterium]MDY0043984.1 ribbon-helix-helix domain-containing protein [Syntrophales bacterium]